MDNLPKNVEIVFEDYCKGCDVCEPVIIERQTEGVVNRVTCNNTAICRKVRTIAATEKARLYPFV